MTNDGITGAGRGQSVLTQPREERPGCLCFLTANHRRPSWSRGNHDIVRHVRPVGQPAEIQLDAFPDLRLLGEVSRVVPTVDRSKATLLVKVAFVERDARVLPDMSAKIGFLSRALAADERKITQLRVEVLQPTSEEA